LAGIDMICGGLLALSVLKGAGRFLRLTQIGTAFNNSVSMRLSGRSPDFVFLELVVGVESEVTELDLLFEEGVF
jgi:hypothetical protein